MTSVGAETGVKAGIVLATYNGAQFLPEQLQSFLTQERLPDELLVSDDASTDDTLAIVEGFARKAPFPVRVSVNPERLGFIQNFAKALALSDADVIFMSDQDDVWFPAKLATMLAAVEEHPDKLLFVCDAELVEEDLSPTGLTIFGQKNPDAGAERSSTYGCCFALRRETPGLRAAHPRRVRLPRQVDGPSGEGPGGAAGRRRPVAAVPAARVRTRRGSPWRDRRTGPAWPRRCATGWRWTCVSTCARTRTRPASGSTDWSGWRRRGSLTAAPRPWTWPGRPRA